MRVGSYRQPNSDSRKSGYTLVELLVVISILGILAAIMFPAIHKAREKADIAVCLSNMKQIGSALQLYLNQYDERFPSAAPWGSPSFWKQGIKVNGFPPQNTIQELLNPFVKNGMSSYSVKSNTYYEKRGVFVCPSDSGLSSDTCKTMYDSNGNINSLYGVPMGKPIWKYAGCSYEYFATNQQDINNPNVYIKWTGVSPFLLNPYPQATGAPLSAVPTPSRKPIIGDIEYWHMGDVMPGPCVGYRNTIFADGHADRIRGKDQFFARNITLRQWHSDDIKEIDRLGAP